PAPTTRPALPKTSCGGPAPARSRRRSTHRPNTPTPTCNETRMRVEHLRADTGDNRHCWCGQAGHRCTPLGGSRCSACEPYLSDDCAAPTSSIGQGLISLERGSRPAQLRDRAPSQTCWYCSGPESDQGSDPEAGPDATAGVST